ncbi:MAG: 5-formyltetrahydrofolate cyclo-ligase [Burkholderiaceae bacterium]
MNAGAEKRAARQRLLAWRKAMPAALRVAAQAAIAARLDAWLGGWQQHRATPTLAVYWPIRGEPDLREHYLRWRDQGVRLALPVTPAGPLPLQFARWEADARLQRDAFGIPTPVECEFCEPDALLVPCVGFAPGGWRLGYGGGFYDRTLASRAVVTIGVAFDDCEWPELPCLAHDRPLSMIVTERRVIAGAPLTAD